MFIGDSSTRTRFERWFTEIEDANKCAGICSVGYMNPNDVNGTRALFYLFSNVNNGKPKMSCKVPVMNSVLKEVSFYTYTLYAFAFASFVALSSLIGILLSKCINCKQNKASELKKERAANGMVVNANDFDEIDNSDSKKKQRDIELAEIDAARAKKYKEKEKAISDFRREMGSTGQSKQSKG